jgi:hypothetical protein
MRLSLLRLGLAGAIAGGCLAEAPVSATTSAAEVPLGFTSNMANVNGVRLHFVSGGAGPALILIHGFPQDWTERVPASQDHRRRYPLAQSSRQSDDREHLG